MRKFGIAPVGVMGNHRKPSFVHEPNRAVPLARLHLTRKPRDHMVDAQYHYSCNNSDCVRMRREACEWSDLKTGGLYGAREFDKIAGSDFGRAQARPQGEGQDGPSPSHPLRQSRRAAWLSDEGLQRRMAWRCALRSVNLTRLDATNSASRQFASSRPMLSR